MNHLVGNIHPHDAALRHSTRENFRQPPTAAADVENIVVGADAHHFEHRPSDRPVVVLHRFALARIGPAVEFLAQQLILFRVDTCGSLRGATKTFSYVGAARNSETWAAKSGS